MIQNPIFAFMRLIRNSYIGWICIVILWSCGSGNSSSQVSSRPAETDTFRIKTGTVFQVPCQNNPQWSYQVYVPKALQKNTQAPLVIWFDPHKSANIPLEKYQNVAESLKCIMVASDQSENGLNSDQYIQIGRSIYEDVITRFPVDTQHIMAGGFSGGARVALLLASVIPQISGVIMNAAGSNRLPRSLRSFFLLGGNSDFNLQEMYSGMKSIHPLLPSGMHIFNGKHEWAPEEEMKAALTFNLNPKPKIYQQELVNFKKMVEEWDPVFKQEKALQEEYLNKLSQHQDTPYWKQEMYLLQQNPALKTMQGKAMQARLMGFLSIYAWSACSQMLRERQANGLEIYTNLYRTVDPGNPEWAFMKAIGAARLKDAAQCKRYLTLAKAMGFTESNRIRNDADILAVLSPEELRTY